MKKLAPLLAIAVFCLSCDAPFDISYSQAAAVVSKMTLQQTIGPVYELDENQRALDPVFLPEKKAAAPGIDFQNGFLLLRGTYRTSLGCVRFDGATGSYRVIAWWSDERVNPDPNFQPFLFEPLKFPTLSYSGVGLVGLDPVDPSNSSVQLLNADISSGSIDSAGWLNLRGNFINFLGPGPLYDANVLGFSIYPTDSAQPFDTSYWLVRMDSGIDMGKLREVVMNVDATGLSNKIDTKAPSSAFDIPELAGLKRCQYFHDPDPIRGPTVDDKKSYVSWFDPDVKSWRCVRWNGAGFTDYSLLPWVTHRIDALLTTGRLFSTEGGIGRVYDAGGVQIASFALGALRFIGERYVDGAPLALFSLARTIRERDSESLAIDVYSIPAVDLEALGK